MNTPEECQGLIYEAIFVGLTYISKNKTLELQFEILGEQEIIEVYSPRIPSELELQELSDFIEECCIVSKDGEIYDQEQLDFDGIDDDWKTSKYTVMMYQLIFGFEDIGSIEDLASYE